ncbi:MAG: hypothetical protein KDE48_08655 [Anaerolineales bacterium]|nr:hypothetical protein [Anaerolineales bacterium]
MPNINLLLIGGGIGLTVAIVGAILDYWLHLRPGKPTPLPGEPRQPGCILFAIGGLSLTGLVALAAAFILTGGLWPAIILGLGTFIGFYAGFLTLLIIWLKIDKQPQQPPTEETSTSGTFQDIQGTE